MSEFTNFDNINNLFSNISITDKAIDFTGNTGGEKTTVSFFDRVTNKEVEVEVYDKKLLLR